MHKLTTDQAVRAATLLIRAGVPFEHKRDHQGDHWLSPVNGSEASLRRAVASVREQVQEGRA